MKSHGESSRAYQPACFSVQEEERRRIARELHDSFGQTLAAMKFSIENAIGENRMRDSEESFRLLGQFIPIIQDAIVEVRNIYTGLRPTILDDWESLRP